MDGRIQEKPAVSRGGLVDLLDDVGGQCIRELSTFILTGRVNCKTSFPNGPLQI